MDKQIIEEAIEMTKGIPGSDSGVLTPLLNQEQAEEDTNYKVRIEVDILRDTNVERFNKDLARKLEQGRETIGSTVPVMTNSGIIFFQTIKRAVATLNDAEISLEDEINGENLSKI